MTKLELTYALAALMATTGLAQAGTITITTDGSSAITHYAGSSDNPGTTFDETTQSGVIPLQKVDKIFANEINDNAQGIASNTQTITDFETLFGSVQTTVPTPISSTVKDPLKTGGVPLDDARIEVAKIDNNSTLKGEWGTYIDHVEAKAAAGEKITMEQPASPVAGDFTGAGVPAGMVTKLTGLNSAVGNYSSQQLPHEAMLPIPKQMVQMPLAVQLRRP